MRARGGTNSVFRIPGWAVGLCLVVLAGTTPVFSTGFGGTVEDMLVRGDSLLAQNRLSEAIVQYQEARTLCPTPFQEVSSLRGEAAARMTMRELLPAAGLLEEAAHRFPEDPRAAELLYQAGNARFEAMDMEGVVRNMREALDLSPTADIIPSLKFKLAQALRRMGRPAEAVELLENSEGEFTNKPMHPAAIYTQAIALHDLGELERSEELYRSILEQFPNSQAALETPYELAEVLRGRGKSTEAVEFYRSFANVNPNSPLAATALERAGDLMLFRSPRSSVRLYGLAIVKANTNTAPPVPGMGVTEWLETKRTLAEWLSSFWVVGILAIVLLAGLVALVLVGRRVMRRWRAPHRVGA